MRMHTKVKRRRAGEAVLHCEALKLRASCRDDELEVDNPILYVVRYIKTQLSLIIINQFHTCITCSNNTRIRSSQLDESMYEKITEVSIRWQGVGCSECLIRFVS